MQIDKGSYALQPQRASKDLVVTSQHLLVETLFTATLVEKDSGARMVHAQEVTDGKDKHLAD